MICKRCWTKSVQRFWEYLLKQTEKKFTHFLNILQLVRRDWHFFFFLLHLYWSIIALQWCVSFCFITKWIHIHIHISPYLLPLVSPSHPPYPTPLGGHKALSWSPCAILLVYISPCHSLILSQLTLPPPCVLKSILYVYVFIPVLPLGSSEPFFFFFFFRF